MKVDLAIKRGTVAIPRGTFEADIYIQCGKILAVGRFDGIEFLGYRTDILIAMCGFLTAKTLRYNSVEWLLLSQFVSAKND
jgi:hypothetical protein